MRADRGFLREHHSIRAVPDCVGDVRCLGARGAVRGDHGLEHLGRRDDGHTGAVGLVDHVLLHGGQLAELEFDAEVAPRDHDRVRHLEDLGEIADRLELFELGDHGD